MYKELEGKRAVVGIRVSSDKQQKQGDSPEDQREQITRFALNNNIQVTDYLSFAESAAKQVQPMQKLVDFCKLQKGAVDVVIVKSIDRFTRGGAEAYMPLKAQLDAMGIQLVDIYGVIDSRVVNTLDHLGMSYKWSRSTPSRKLELLEAERAKEEVSQILTRVIGSEIRFTQLGYWMRAAPYGYKGIKQNTPHGKRTILVPDETESFFIRKIYELKSANTLTDTQICDAINRLGFKSRLRVFHSRTDGSIIKEAGGEPMKQNNLYRYYQSPTYAGIIQEKWTHGMAIKGQIKPIVSIKVFNQANRGLKQIVESKSGITIIKDERPSIRQPESVIDDQYPFRRSVVCPTCRKPFIGSSSTGKSGKRYPAYLCRRGHMLRIPKAEFEANVRSFIDSIQIKPDALPDFHAAILALFDNVDAAQAGQEIAMQKRVDALQAQLKSYLRKIAIMENETAIRYMEDEMEKTQQELMTIKQDEPIVSNFKETDSQKIANYLTYFVTHLTELVFDLCNNAQKKAFFGLIFNKTPTYDILKSHTPKTALPPEVNELFGLNNDYYSHLVISWRIELQLPG